MVVSLRGLLTWLCFFWFTSRRFYNECLLKDSYVHISLPMNAESAFGYSRGLTTCSHHVFQHFYVSKVWGGGAQGAVRDHLSTMDTMFVRYTFER